MRISAFLLVVLSATSGCNEPTLPSGDGTLALLTTVNSRWFTVADLHANRVVASHPSGLTFAEDARAFSMDSTLMIYSGAGTIVAFDLTTRSILWHQQLGAEERARFGGQSIYANFALAFAPSGPEILLADSYLNGSAGVAIFNGRKGTASGWIGPLRAFKLLTLPSNILGSDGGVLALGTRSLATSGRESDRRRGKLYFLAGSPLQIQDSIAFLSAEDTVAGGIVDAVLSDDARFLYFITYGRVLRKFDLLTRQRVSSLAVPIYGPLVRARGNRILVVDGASSRDGPGSGTILLADAELRSVDQISLADASYDGMQPVLNGAAVSPDGSEAYVAAGTSPVGPLFGAQPGRVLVVDLRTNRLIRMIETGTWGVRSILPLR